MAHVEIEPARGPSADDFRESSGSKSRGVASPRKPWDYGLSEEGRTDRFWNAADLPAILHPNEEGSATTALRFKRSADGGQDCFFIGRFSRQFQIDPATGDTREPQTLFFESS